MKIKPGARIPAFARKIEKSLEAGRGAPPGKEEKRLALDLAELNVRVSLLGDALQALAAGGGARKGPAPYHVKLIRVAHEIAEVQALTRSLRRPFNALVRAQCRKEGETFTRLALAGSAIKGFVPPK